MWRIGKQRTDYEQEKKKQLKVEGEESSENHNDAWDNSRILSFVCVSRNKSMSVIAPIHTQRRGFNSYIHTCYTLSRGLFLTPPPHLSSQADTWWSLFFVQRPADTCFGSVWLTGILCVGLLVPEEQRGFYQSHQCDSPLPPTTLVKDFCLVTVCHSRYCRGKKRESGRFLFGHNGMVEFVGRGVLSKVG